MAHVRMGDRKEGDVILVPLSVHHHHVIFHSTDKTRIIIGLQFLASFLSLSICVESKTTI